MKNRRNYLLTKRACLQINGSGTKALEEEFGIIILNNGRQVTIARLEEEFGVDITNVAKLQKVISNANSLVQ